ncbi:hypothetical protein FA13DRAFT_1711815 [Coprinellus micaceus]|uniref:Uncharacterized protein n=1 Tax=Coprinellus micaceus TaxID=71717 RepID=A0A4Y7T303_COPMI|nr:hypothetical protein FA13DRAFT_1711815 [Coprinellus micaceus]
MTGCIAPPSNVFYCEGLIRKRCALLFISYLFVALRLKWPLYSTGTLDYDVDVSLPLSRYKRRSDDWGKCSYPSKSRRWNFVQMSSFSRTWQTYLAGDFAFAPRPSHSVQDLGVTPRAIGPHEGMKFTVSFQLDPHSTIHLRYLRHFSRSTKGADEEYPTPGGSKFGKGPEAPVGTGVLGSQRRPFGIRVSLYGGSPRLTWRRSRTMCKQRVGNLDRLNGLPGRHGQFGPSGQIGHDRASHVPGRSSTQGDSDVGTDNNNRDRLPLVKPCSRRVTLTRNAGLHSSPLLRLGFMGNFPPPELAHFQHTCIMLLAC